MTGSHLIWFYDAASLASVTVARWCSDNLVFLGVKKGIADQADFWVSVLLLLDFFQKMYVY